MLKEYFGDRNYFFRTMLFTIMGNLICSFAVVNFLIPAGLLAGGLGGIGLMLEYLFKIPTGISIFILNLPMMILGFKFLNKRFMTYVFFSIFLFSFTLIIMRKFPINLVLEEKILYAIFGGAINGLGMGILFRNGSCQGGFDIVAAIVKTRLNKSLGSTLLTVNGIIISVASYIFSVERGLLTVIAMFIAYKILDKIQMGFGASKQLMIITSNPRDITERILMDLSRGVTLLHAEGAFTHKPQNVILCILSTRQVATVKKIINEIDPKAFLIISEAYEVKGKGFRTGEL